MPQKRRDLGRTDQILEPGWSQASTKWPKLIPRITWGTLLDLKLQAYGLASHDLKLFILNVKCHHEL